MLNSILDAEIRAGFDTLRKDYLGDSFKYLSEADVVYSFGLIFSQRSIIKNLISCGDINLHFEAKPYAGMNQADMVIVTNTTEGINIHAVIEFKIRVQGNKQRCLIDLEQLRTLREINIIGYVFILDRCAPKRTISNYIDTVLSVENCLRKNILVVCKEDDTLKSNDRQHNNPYNSDINIICSRARKVLSELNEWGQVPWSEADIVFEAYSRLADDYFIDHFISRGFIDIHFELRPYIKKNGVDWVIVKDKSDKDISFKLIKQKFKNQGVRIDLSITTRAPEAIKNAYSKASSDQHGKMKFWRILSHPADNMIFFAEFKKTKNYITDLYKLQSIDQVNSTQEKFIVYQESNCPLGVRCNSYKDLISITR